MNQRSYLYFAFKVKDGLFIGDFNSIQSNQERDFLLQNKITYIVNCAAGQLIPPNFNIPLNFLNFHWVDSDEQVILDALDDNIKSIQNFLQEANQNGEGALICSLRGQSRSLTIMTAYLMKNFAWSLYKALEYMNSKRQDFEIRASFLKQLLDLDQRLSASLGGQQSKSWNDQSLDPDNTIIQNTFINSQLCLYKGPVNTEKKPDFKITETFHGKTIQPKVKWDQNLATFINESVQTDIQVPLKMPDSILKTGSKQKLPRENFHQSKQNTAAQKMQTSLEFQDREKVQKLRKTPIPDYRAQIQESMKKKEMQRPPSPYQSRLITQQKTQTSVNNDNKQARVQTEQQDNLKNQNQIQFNINLNINQLHLVGMQNQNHLNRKNKRQNQQQILNKSQQESFIRKVATRENSPDVQDLPKNNKIVKSSANTPEREPAKIVAKSKNFQPRSQSDQIKKEQFDEAIRYYETRKNLQQTVQKYLPQLPTKSQNFKLRGNGSDTFEYRNFLNQDIQQRNNFLKQDINASYSIAKQEFDGCPRLGSSGILKADRQTPATLKII